MSNVFCTRVFYKVYDFWSGVIIELKFHGRVKSALCMDLGSPASKAELIETRRARGGTHS